MALTLRSPSVTYWKLIDRLHRCFCLPHLISLTEDACFLDIPKIGSSFFKSTLCRNGYCKFGMGSSYPHSNIYPRPLIFNSSSINTIICFWKNPIDRFCSVIREKLIQSSNSWSPMSLPYGPSFDVEHVDDLIEFFVRQPYSVIDKHLLPQTLFHKPYRSHHSFRLLHHSQIDSVLLKYFPSQSFQSNYNISLVTDQSLFNRKNLSTHSLTLLSRFYQEDLLLSPSLSIDCLI